MAPIENEQDRREQIRHLEQQKLQMDRNHAAEIAKVNEKLRRLEPLPQPDICEPCWYDHREISMFRAVPISEAIALPPGQDLYACIRCGHRIVK